MDQAAIWDHKKERGRERGGYEKLVSTPCIAERKQRHVLSPQPVPECRVKSYTGSRMWKMFEARVNRVLLYKLLDL